MSISAGRGGAAGAVRDDEAVPMMQPEGLLGEAGFFLGGEEDAVGVAKDPVLGEEPVGPFFYVFGGEGVLEVGVEHAVGEDDVGLAALHGEGAGDAGKLPEAVDDDAIEAVPVGFEPRVKARAVAVAVG